jgi:hypothetical protein
MTRRPRPLQRAHILFVQANRGRNQSCHTLTIQRTAQLGNLRVGVTPRTRVLMLPNRHASVRRPSGRSVSAGSAWRHAPLSLRCSDGQSSSPVGSAIRRKWAPRRRHSARSLHNREGWAGDRPCEAVGAGWEDTGTASTQSRCSPLFRHIGSRRRLRQTMPADPHSARRPSTGSTRIARSAGGMHATRAATRSSPPAATVDVASDGDTS